MDKIREEFETWWQNANPRLTDLPKEQAYYIWKASRAALVVKIPEEHDLGDGTTGVMQDDFAKSLEDAGVSYE